MRDLDQFLLNRNGRWHYIRRVPQCYAHLDTRNIIRTSLRTASLEVARARRDALVEADDHFWVSLGAENDLGLSELLVGQTANALQRYEVAKRRAMARGYIYTPVNELAETAQLQELIERLTHVGKQTINQGVEAEAVLGGAQMPTVSITDALNIYCEKIALSELLGKSENQKKSWRKVKQRAVNYFVELYGDLPMDQITRKQGRDFYNWWGERLTPKKGKPGLSANSANRDLGNLRKLYRVYWEYVGEEGRENPFRNLHFTDNSIRDVPPFADQWVRSRILLPKLFEDLKPEAVLIVFGLIETGCRPSELANLRSEHIILDHEVPHIKIKPTSERQLKSASSIRDIPLVGVSLEAFKQAPNGFPHYQDKGNLLSASLMKAFRARKLFPTDQHRIYSFRHSFEKRMLEAGLDYGLRCLLMGHKNSRPNYGDGGSMVYRRTELMKIAHPVPMGFARDLKSIC